MAPWRVCANSPGNSISIRNNSCGLGILWPVPGLRGTASASPILSTPTPMCSPQPVWLSLNAHHTCGGCRDCSWNPPPCSARLLPKCQGPGTKPGLAEQPGAEDAYLHMELPQALLEELGIRGEGDRSHLCKTWPPSPQPPDPRTSFFQHHPHCQGSWHLPWLRHL